MIFRPELAKLILQGRKSQTRYVATTRTCRYEVGKAYAIEAGRGKPAIGRVTVTDVRLETLGYLTLRDAKREGFLTTADFFEHWREVHGTVDRSEQVWVITFTLGDSTDEPRLLAARMGTSHGDYTSNPHLAADGEPEAISEHETERYSKIAHARDMARGNEPLRKQRDQIAHLIAQMYEQAPGSSSTIRDSIRRLERELAVLNRKLAA